MTARLLLPLALVCTLPQLSHALDPRATPRPDWPFASRPGAAASPAPKVAGGLNTAQAAQLEADRAKLLEGVKTIPRLGAPGPVAAYGALAFPLIVAREGKAAEALAAAATAGKGHAVIFGHTGYLEAGQNEDLDRLLLNALRWCSGKEKPRIGVKGAKIGPLLSKAGLRSEDLGKIDKGALNGHDVVVISAQSLSDPADAVALKEYLARGGGIISAVTGWAFGQTSGGKDFVTENRGNEMLADAGLAFTAESLTGGKLEVVSAPEPMLNAWTAIAALQPAPSAPAPSADAVQAGTRTIQLALGHMPAATKPAYQRLIAAALASLPSNHLPSTEKPLLESADGEARARVALQARLTRFLAPADIRPSPAAERFPGKIGAQAKPVTKTITVDPGIPAWHSTGLYAAPGAAITVKLPPELANQGYGVRIGCHTDQLYSLEKWSRMPELSVTAPLATAETTAANTFGGLIYLTVPDKAKQSQPFQATIAGGLESPLFILGRTTDAQWQQQRHGAAPWAELACQGVIITVPAEVARDIKKPTELMKFWQAVVDAEDDLAGTTEKRRRPERIVPDVQISAGFMHSGYPIMIHLPQARDMTTLEPNRWPGWGFYHELGHNHQDSAWTFPGTTEVTCNLFSLYIIDAVHRQPMRTGHGAVTEESQRKSQARYFAGGAKFEQWKSDPFLALGIYIQLIDGFGFDTLKKVIHSYHGTEFGPAPKTEEEKHDQWMVRYAKISGKNLGPLFDKWGIPVSSAAKAEIASLPAWMPAGM